MMMKWSSSLVHEWSVRGVLLLVAALSSLCPAQTPAEQKLEATVRTMYRASRDAITTIECNYTFTVNNGAIVREMRYRKDGDRVYLAGANMLADGGIGLPDEVSWDGRQAFHRSSLKAVMVSNKRERARGSCETPESGISLSVDEALGLAPPRGEYRLLSARELQWENNDCIELSWRVVRLNFILTARHARNMGYWPVWTAVTDDAGKVHEQTDQVRYAQRESGGNALFYPVLVVSRIDPAKPGNTLVWTVDETTLKLNEQIPITQFQIEFWPSDDVLDFEKGKVRSALDPNWSPVGRAGFPWDKVVMLLVKNGKPLPGVGPQAAPSVSPQASLATVPPAAMTPAPAPAYERALQWLIPAGVVLCLAGVGYWFRQRRSA